MRLGGERNMRHEFDHRGLRASARQDTRFGRRSANVRANGRAGHTVLEVLIAFLVLCAGLLGFARAIGSSMTASTASYESTRAREAAREMLELIATSSTSEVFALYNDDPNDDPGGVGTAPGPHFEVEGLPLSWDDDNAFAGEVLLPVFEKAPGMLREDFSGGLGMPRDLNGDGDIDDADHSGDYLMLPVTVRVEWRGSSGTSQVELRTMLGNMQ